MSPMELILTMLGEESTREIARSRYAIGFDENLKAARNGGRIAGQARRELEQKTKKRVVRGKSGQDQNPLD
ncbi:MAG: hypothetical protein ABIB71_05740 [Candidatus Woesearchaeota archaeon]